MKRLFALVMLALTVVTMGLPSATRAASEVYRFRGQIADASFLTPDAMDPCIVTDVWVRGFSGGTVQPGHTQTPGLVAVQLTRYNRCQEAPSLISADGIAWLSEEALHIDRQLNTAFVRATIDLYDVVSDTTFPVALDLTWTGSGDTIRGRNWTHARQTNSLSITSMAETIRISEAHGTVMLRGDNVTPAPAWDAKLATRTTSELTVSR